MLYSHNGNYPELLPFSITMPDGMTRTDPETFTEEELTSAGYVLAGPEPTYDFKNQKLEWINNNWIVADLTYAEKRLLTERKWDDIRSIRNRLINEFTWRIDRHNSEVRLGLEPTDKIEFLDDYVQKLRDVTKQSDPWNIIWPSIINATDPSNQYTGSNPASNTVPT